jgi:hypothetical protein
MSGFELLSVVRRRFPEIPVIATRGDYDPLVLPPCVVCDAFFRKDHYRTPELLARVAELLNGEPRPALWKGAPVPVWLPRGRDDYNVVTCTNCLRSFPRTKVVIAASVAEKPRHTSGGEVLVG